MTELSLSLLDLCENAVSAGARHVEVSVIRKDGWTRFLIQDDGRGMNRETLENCQNPFFTTRSTRRVGMGLSLMREQALRCGGEMRIESAPGQGTRVDVSLRHGHFDCPPMGDLRATVQALFLWEAELVFRYEGEEGAFGLETQKMKETLAGVPLHSVQALKWIGDELDKGFCRADGEHALTAGDIFFGGAYTMKSIAELEAIRVKTLEQVNLRREHEGASHVVVGMGTCGIAAGAREVVKAFMAAANAHELMNMTIAQSGCMGRCDLEPMVEVSCPGQEKVTYVKVKPEMVDRIVTEHVMGGKPVEEYIAK